MKIEVLDNGRTLGEVGYERRVFPDGQPHVILERELTGAKVWVTTALTWTRAISRTSPRATISLTSLRLPVSTIAAA